MPEDFVAQVIDGMYREASEVEDAAGVLLDRATRLRKIASALQDAHRDAKPLRVVS